jgi:hypothetical protein
MGRLNHLCSEAARVRDAALAARDPEDHEGSAWIFDGAETVASGAPASFCGPRMSSFVDSAGDVQ